MVNRLIVRIGLGMLLLSCSMAYSGQLEDEARSDYEKYLGE